MENNYIIKEYLDKNKQLHNLHIDQIINNLKVIFPWMSIEDRKKGAIEWINLPKN